MKKMKHLVSLTKTTAYRMDFWMSRDVTVNTEYSVISQICMENKLILHKTGQVWIMRLIRLLDQCSLWHYISSQMTEPVPGFHKRTKLAILALMPIKCSHIHVFAI